MLCVYVCRNQASICLKNCRTVWCTAGAFALTASSIRASTPGSTKCHHSLSPKPGNTWRKEVKQSNLYSGGNINVLCTDLAGRKELVASYGDLADYMAENLKYKDDVSVFQQTFFFFCFLIEFCSRLLQEQSLCFIMHVSWLGFTPVAWGPTPPTLTHRRCGTQGAKSVSLTHQQGSCLNIWQIFNFLPSK